jgi:hypothetical protein
MLFKLLWRNQSLWQILGASLGALTGITLLLMALQTRESFNHVLESEDELFPAKYLTLSKKVSLLSNLPGMRPSFSNREIENLKKHPGVMGATTFSAAGFQSIANMAIPNFPEYQTELFLESLPAEFLESLPANWKWTPESPHVPILLPNSFLHLYNFGFAPANGYPQVSKNMINKVRFTLLLRGKSGNKLILPARISAFSDRITTILVPESFMEWSSAQLTADNKPIPPYRILLKTRTPISPDLLDLLEKKKYETNSELLNGSKAASMAKLALGGTGFIGLLLLLLAFLAFWLSFQVLIHRSSNQLRTLLHIGYPPKQLFRHYLVVFLVIGSTLYVLAIAVAYIAIAKTAVIAGNYGVELKTGLHTNTLIWTLAPTTALVFLQCLSMRVTLEKLARS